MTTKKLIQPRRNPHRSPSGTFTCPLPPAWRNWDLLGMTYRSGCPDRSAERMAEARNAPRGEPIKLLRLQWEVAADDASVKPLVGREMTESAMNRHRHIHAEFGLNGHIVHVDVVAAIGYGPLRGFYEARIFIDGELAGRGGFGGAAVGCGGSDLPAVALGGQGDLIVVADGDQSWAGGFDAAPLRPVVTLHKIVTQAAGLRSTKSVAPSPPAQTPLRTPGEQAILDMVARTEGREYVERWAERILRQARAVGDL